MLCKLLCTLKEATGSTATEYAVIAFLISIGVIGAVTIIGTSLPPTFITVAAVL
jgi:Flp pilus assembly pilin Flp